MYWATAHPDLFPSLFPDLVRFTFQYCRLNCFHVLGQQPTPICSLQFTFQYCRLNCFHALDNSPPRSVLFIFSVLQVELFSCIYNNSPRCSLHFSVLQVELFSCIGQQPTPICPLYFSVLLAAGAVLAENEGKGARTVSRVKREVGAADEQLNSNSQVMHHTL